MSQMLHPLPRVHRMLTIYQDNTCTYTHTHLVWHTSIYKHFPSIYMVFTRRWTNRDKKNSEGRNKVSISGHWMNVKCWHWAYSNFFRLTLETNSEYDHFLGWFISNASNRQSYLNHESISKIIPFLWGHKPGVIRLPTQTMHYYKGNPQNLSYICIVWFPQNGSHLMPPANNYPQRWDR